MMTNAIAIILLSMTAAATKHTAAAATPSLPARSIHSTLGFTFRPPPGGDWTESFGQHVIEYGKQTDPHRATFVAGVHELYLDVAPADQAALAASVRARKDAWGSDGRFTDRQTAVQPERARAICVWYRVAVHDKRAPIRKDLPFLILRGTGRVCTHPGNPHAAVDIFYTLRHVPGLDTRQFDAEGNAFIDSLTIDPLPGNPMRQTTGSAARPVPSAFDPR